MDPMSVDLYLHLGKRQARNHPPTYLPIIAPTTTLWLWIPVSR
jgi:hypothetical protein